MAMDILTYDLNQVAKKMRELESKRKVIDRLVGGVVEIKLKTLSADCFRDNSCSRYCYILTIFYPTKEDGGYTNFEKDFDTADELSKYLDAMEDALRISHGEEL